MPISFFVSDLHGRTERYRKLWQAIREERPAAVFLGGDLLPHLGGFLPRPGGGDRGFLGDVILPALRGLRKEMGESYPRFFAILGNDDARSEEEEMLRIESEGLWNYVHARRVPWDRYLVLGYSFVPPTPFLLKDWEHYDVSRFVDPGCVPPDEGWRTTPASSPDLPYATIARDLDLLAGDVDLGAAILLIHAPPYGTVLDRAALDGRVVDSVPMDVHVGSIAVRRFIEDRHPRITLHGHVHESTRLTGEWMARLGETHAFTAAHDGPELALVRFDPEDPASATRTLL